MAEVREVSVPDIGDFADVPIVEILVAVGDTVAPEDPLVTLESDKAAMDIPAPVGGVVEEIKVSVGDTVSEGVVLLTLKAGADDDAPASGAEAPAKQPSEPVAAPEPSESAAEPAVSTDKPTEEPAAPAEQPAAAAEEPAAPAGGDVYAGPGARRRARELGVDLATVAGTGRKGRIVVADVEAASKAPTKPPAAAAGTGLDLLPWPEVDFAEFGEVEIKPLTRIQKISGRVMERNWARIPHVTQFDQADITGLEDFRVRTNQEQAEGGVKLTMVALLLKACVATLKQFPELNSSLDGENLVIKHYYHLGFAADTPGGLVVPVIRDVDSKGLFDVASELRELSGKAREGKLSPKEMAGGTFTISSLGGIGGTAFTPIINAPEVAILGVSRSQTQPVWNGKEFAPRLMLPLSLSYDHRVIDGAAAARFTTHLAGVLVDLRQVLL